MKTSASIVSSAKINIAAQSRKGIAYLLISRFSGIVIALLSSSIMGRLLGPADYGLVAMALSLMILLTLLKDFGLTTALIQADTIDVDQIDGVFWINLVLALCFAMVGSAVAPFVATFYGEPRVRDVVLALCFGIVISSSMATHAAILRRHLDFNPLMWAEIAGQVASLVVGVAVAWWVRSYWAIVASTLSAAMATAAITFIGLPWIPGAPRSPKSARKLVKFGANLSLFSLLNYFSNQLGAIIVGVFSGSVAVGHFNRAQQLLNLSGSTLMQPISQVVLPTLSRLQHDAESYRSTYLAILRRTSFGFAVIGAVVILEGDHAAAILLGPKWSEAGLMFRWFGLAIVAVGMASHTGNVLMSQFRTAELRNWGFGDAFIRAGASIIGLTWGSIGVAAAYSMASLFVTVPIVAYIIGRHGPVRFFDQLRTIRPAIFLLIAAVPAGLIARSELLPTNSLLSIPVNAIIIFVAVCIAMILDPVGRLIWSDIVEMLSRRSNREKDSTPVHK